MKYFDLQIYPTDVELAKEVARRWLETVSEKGDNGQSVALSGGRITRQFFSEVTRQASVRNISLDGVDFFWADERRVPPTDPESNFALANETLLQPLKIPAEKIHRIRGELDLAGAVAQANSDLAQILNGKSGGAKAGLDIVFLGVGEDGHVASLFPNASSDTKQSTENFLGIENSPKPPPQRITLSYNAIASAKEVWVLVSGKGKEQVLAESLSEAGETPLAQVLKWRRHTSIFTDLPIVAS